MNYLKCLLLVLLTSTLYSQVERVGVVMAVHDGDSYAIFFPDDSSRIWVRVIGVDCPEVISNHITENQPWGIEVGTKVRELLKGQPIIAITYGYDKYGRLLARIFHNSIEINDWLLASGYGVYLTSETPLKLRRHYQYSRSKARKDRLAIWGDPHMMTPYQWRVRHWRH